MLEKAQYVEIGTDFTDCFEFGWFNLSDFAKQKTAEWYREAA